MGWKEKSEEIAGAILRRELDAGHLDDAGHELLERLLPEAVLEGIKWECDCWVKKSR